MSIIAYLVLTQLFKMSIFQYNCLSRKYNLHKTEMNVRVNYFRNRCFFLDFAIYIYIMQILRVQKIVYIGMDIKISIFFNLEDSYV